MNSILCEFLKVSEHKRQKDGSRYYSVHILLEYRVVILFFSNIDLYEKLQKIEKGTAIQLHGNLKARDEYSFSFVPEAFEM